MKEPSLTNQSPEICGGKGSALFRLQALGYKVPPFVVIPVSFFEKLHDDPGMLNEATFISAWEKSGIAQEIMAVLGGAERLAVRSSATAEDGMSHSFAGQFHSELNVGMADLPAAIIRVWMSGFAASVTAYKKAGDISSRHRMAVIVQLMIDADMAGVGFGAHPLSGEENIAVINAVTGLGASLVSGSENADVYEVDAGNRIRTEAVHSTPVLNEDHVLEVVQVLRRLSKDFGSAQDIEFAFAGGTLWLLQSRPITARASKAGERIVWDNSNIVESYPGLTLPLTFSFIEKMYGAVYRQFSLVIGVSRKAVSQSDAVFDAMLGLLNGRVYYNLNSWYAALALLPGYSLNARFMEGMMGVKEPPPVPVIKPRPAGLSAYWDVARAIVTILRNLRNARRERVQFAKRFEQVYAGFYRKDFSAQSLQKTWEDYTKFEALMLAEWKAPLVNDFFAMIYFGVLQKLTAKYQPGQPDIHNELVGASKDIITTQPVRLLPRIAGLIIAESSLRRIALEETPARLWEAIQTNKNNQALEAVEDYLNAWGERTIGELKLETITYLQEPLRLIAILQSYVRSGIVAYKETNDEMRNDAEDAIKAALSGKPLRRRIFNHALKHARYFVSNRENLRYFRTRGFGMVRQMMSGLGVQMAHQKLLDEPRDIFYLTLDEVRTAATNPISYTQIIAERKARYTAYEGIPLPQRIITEGPPPEYLLLPDAASAGSQHSGNIIQGTACSAGVVRARVRLVTDAEALTSLDSCIMATYATDPGYVVLFPTAAGILTERGSLLSHAAIVSREMGIPCIVGLDGLMTRLRDGDEVIMDGKSGIVQIVSPDE